MTEPILFISTYVLLHKLRHHMYCIGLPPWVFCSRHVTTLLASRVMGVVWNCWSGVILHFPHYWLTFTLGEGKLILRLYPGGKLHPWAEPWVLLPDFLVVVDLCWPGWLNRFSVNCVNSVSLTLDRVISTMGNGWRCKACSCRAFPS